jgi:hypothetical protein
MPTASKPEPKEPLEKSKEALQELIDADFAYPIEPTQDVPKFGRKEKAYKYYLLVKDDLKDWWDEFNTALDKEGNRRYRTVRQFALAKGKNLREQQLIREMIGPQPEKKPRIPWLGDWSQRREIGYSFPAVPAKVKHLAATFKSKIDSTEAVRSTAPYIVLELAQIAKMRENIDRAYNGQMFDPRYAPHSPENEARAKAYMTLWGSTLDMRIKVLDSFMTIHGVNPKDPMQQIQINALTQNVGTASGIMGGIEGHELPRKEMELLKLARAMQAHADNFNMPIPKTLTGEVEEPVVEVQAKKNGKSATQ